MSDARRLPADVLDLWKGGELTSRANRDFVRAFSGSMSANERNEIMTKGGDLSSVGVKRVKAALTARAYGDADIVTRGFEHADDNMKNVSGALQDAAPEWARMRAAVERGQIHGPQDITSDLVQVVKNIMRARDEGRPVSEIFNQGDMFSSDTSTLAARMFFHPIDPEKGQFNPFKKYLSRPAMAENVRSMAEKMRASAEAGTDMFGTEPLTAIEAARAVVKKSDERQAALAKHASSKDDLSASAASPAHADAVTAELERNIARGENRVAQETVNPDTGALETKLGFADPELHAADRDLELADELRKGCLLPFSKQAAE